MKIHSLKLLIISRLLEMILNKHNYKYFFNHINMIIILLNNSKKYDMYLYINTLNKILDIFMFKPVMRMQFMY